MIDAFDLLEHLQEIGIEAEDLAAAVAGEKRVEAKEISDSVLLIAVEYLLARGWTPEAIEREGRAAR